MNPNRAMRTAKYANHAKDDGQPADGPWQRLSVNRPDCRQVLECGDTVLTESPLSGSVARTGDPDLTSAWPGKAVTTRCSVTAVQDAVAPAQPAVQPPTSRAVRACRG